MTDLFWPGRHELAATAVAAIRSSTSRPHLDATPEELPYGRRRLVGIARAVASGPSVVMLDEPAAGLDETESRELAGLIRRLADERNMGVLLVEHDVGLVMSTCDRIVVHRLRPGHRLGHPRRGPGDDELVVAAYLGHADRSRSPASPRRSTRARRRGDVTATEADPPRCGRGQGDTLIEAAGCRRGYGKMAVVRDLDLHVDAGEVVALLGANGAGKTTTLLTLAGELPPMEGEVQFLGGPTTAPMHVRCRTASATSPRSAR